MAMAAARRAAGFNTLTAASNDYGQTTAFNLRDMVTECELSVAAGFAIDVDTQLPNASKNLLDFEIDVCSQHEKSDKTWSSELSGQNANRRVDLPYFRRILEHDPWHDFEPLMAARRLDEAARDGAGGGGGAAPARRNPARRARAARDDDGDSDGGNSSDEERDAVPIGGDLAIDYDGISYDDLLILHSRQSSRYAILVKYIRCLCSERMQVVLKSRIRRQFPLLFTTGTREHWNFIKGIIVASCAAADYFSALTTLTDQLLHSNDIIGIIDNMINFQTVYNDTLTGPQISSILRYQAFGPEVMKILSVSTDINFNDQKTLEEWSAVLDVLDVNVLDSLNMALASRMGHRSRPGGRSKLAKKAKIDQPRSGTTTKSRDSCRNYAAGKCHRGSDCNYSHAASAAAGVTDHQRKMGDGSNPRGRKSSQATPTTCFKCHKSGHRANKCTGQRCPCGATGPPGPGCPKFKASFATVVKSMDEDKHPIVLPTPPTSETVLPLPVVGATIAASASSPLCVFARFQVGGQPGLVDGSTILDTASNVNLIARSFAHDTMKGDNVLVASGGGEFLLSDIATAYISITRDGVCGLQPVQGYVRDDVDMPMGASLLLGIQAVRDLRIDMNSSDLTHGGVGLSDLPTLPHSNPTTPVMTVPIYDINRDAVNIDLECNTGWINSLNGSSILSSMPTMLWSEIKARDFLATRPTFNNTFSIKDISISDDIPAPLRKQILAWADEFSDIFGTNDMPPPSKAFNDIFGPHDITAELHPHMSPFHAPQRSYKPNERKILTLWVRRMVEAGIMVPNPTSPWAAHVHLVDKPGSSKPRFVVDLRELNKRVLHRSTTMPNGVREVERVSSPAKFRFGTDAMTCYTQICVSESSYDANTVHTPVGKYSLTRLSMGYKPSARVQQTYYTAAMQSMPESVRSYFANFADDFAMWQNDAEAFMKCLGEFGTMCRRWGIFLSPRKTTFTGPDTETKFYGFSILPFSAGGGSGVTDAASSALRGMAMPRSVSELRSVLGLLNYSRLLIPDYSSRVFPLTRLTRKGAFASGKFVLDAEAESALRSVVADLTNGAVRHRMLTTSQLRLDVDASGYGWGAHLWQEVERNGAKVPQTIAWLSKTWPPSLRSRPSFVLEVHGLFSALKAVRLWAFSHPLPVRVRTDARSIQWAHLQSRGPIAGYAADAAAETPHTIEYWPGADNVTADALSRPPLVGERTLATHGIGGLFDLLLSHTEPFVSSCAHVWINARHDTSAMSQLVRNGAPKIRRITKASPSTETIKLSTADFAIMAPEPWDAPAIARDFLLQSKSPFAILIPHDLIQEVARFHDGSPDPSAVSALQAVSYVASATTGFTWILRTNSGVPHLVTLATTAVPFVPDGAGDAAHHDARSSDSSGGGATSTSSGGGTANSGTDSGSSGAAHHDNVLPLPPIPLDGSAPPQLADLMDVKTWIGQQPLHMPPGASGELVTRADGLKMHLDIDGILRIVVPEHLRVFIITLAHLELRHLKDKFVLHHLRRHFWFPAMRSLVHDTVMECADCQLSNAHRRLAHGDFHAPSSDCPRSHWQVDSKSFGRGRHALACVDVFSGYTILLPLNDRTAPTCIRAFIDNVVLVFGVPRAVRFDMAGSFGAEFSSTLRGFGVVCTGTGAAHATGNSVAERVWPLVTRHFMLGSNEDIEDFARGLSIIAWASNIYIRAHGFSAFEVMFGTGPISPIHRAALASSSGGGGHATNGDDADTDSADEIPAIIRRLVENHDVTLDECASAGRYLRDTTAMRMNARGGRRASAIFELGQLVVVWRDPSGATNHRHGRPRDYIAHWIGPGTITKVLDHGMYEVSITADATTSVFRRHVSNLLPFHGPIPEPTAARADACAATTAGGHRCTARARFGDFCGRHKSQQSSTATTGNAQ